MENKVFKFQDTEFTMIDNNLLLAKRGNKLLKKYIDLEEEYTGDIDQSLIKKYEDRISDLEIALEQAPEDSKKEFEGNLDKAKVEFESDLKVQSINRRLTKCKGLILKELAEDHEFLKPLFEEVLIGDFTKLDWNSPDMKLFVLEVTANFF